REELGASQVLGVPNQAANFALGRRLWEGGPAGNQAEAQRLLENSLNGVQIPSMRASAQRMLADNAFHRGANARAVELVADALTNRGTAAADLSDRVVSREFRALAGMADQLATSNQRLTRQQFDRLSSVTAESHRRGSVFDLAHSENEQRIQQMVKPPATR